MKRVVVPVDLGGSSVVCAVSTTRRIADAPDVVEALIERYATERMTPGGQLEVGFYRGGLPSEALLAMARPHAIRLACSPADLDLARMTWLKERGLRTLEIEALTLHERVLWGLRRGYDAAAVRGLLADARSLGLEVGLTLVPGLPGHTEEAALDDARFATLADFVRICPALALDGSDIARWAEQGRWRTLELEDAVRLVVDMVEIVEAGGTSVARIGYQPGPDGLERVVAGPHHPNFRGLVESQRFRRRMEHIVAERPAPRKRKIVLRVHPKDLSWAKGTSNENVRWLRERLEVEDVELREDASLARGSLALG